jgi:hypothetical protein
MAAGFSAIGVGFERLVGMSCMMAAPVFIPLELPALSPIFKGRQWNADFSVILNKEIDDGKRYPL